MKAILKGTSETGLKFIDPTAIVSSMRSAVQSYTQAVKQYHLLQQQYQQMQQMENISSGSRGLSLTLPPQVLSNIAPDFKFYRR